jgi:hypothetical protein
MRYHHIIRQSGRCLRAAFLGICLLLYPAPGFTEDAALANIILTNTRDDLLLYLTVNNAFPPDIEETINSGVPTTFSFYVKLNKVRSFWKDEEVADITITHTLKYDNLKKEYIITRSGETDSPAVTKSFEEAKKLMAEVDSLTIGALKWLEKGQQYQIRAKAKLSKVTLPFYLHYILFFMSLWDFETDWYTIDFIY